MPLVRIGLNVNGEQQLSRAFQATSREIEDMSEPLHRVGVSLLRQIGEQFRTEGAAGGSPWRRLSREYAAWKEAHWPGRPLLVASGAMRAAALSPQAISIEPRRLVYEVDGHEGELAYWHQHGSGHNPARPIVQTTTAWRRDVDRTFAEWLNGLRTHGDGLGRAA